MRWCGKPENTKPTLTIWYGNSCNRNLRLYHLHYLARKIEEIAAAEANSKKF
jgi:hypothetical protein